MTTQACRNQCGEWTDEMSTGVRSGLLRDRSGEQRVSVLELYFDLVFVFAVTQLSHGLLTHLIWPGAIQTLILTMAVWTAWMYTTWITNWSSLFRPGTSKPPGSS